MGSLVVGRLQASGAHDTNYPVTQAGIFVRRKVFSAPLRRIHRSSKRVQVSFSVQVQDTQGIYVISNKIKLFQKYFER